MRYLLIPLGLIALAACDRGEVNEVNASVGDVANAVAQSGIDIKMKPGRWESTMRIEDVSGDGLPPQMVEAMKKGMGTPQVIATCLTEADLAKPEGGMFAKPSENCRYDRFKMGGGKVDAVLRCTGPDGREGEGGATVTMTGTYAADSTSTRLVSETQVGAGQSMRMVMSGTSKRAGNCRGDEIKLNEGKAK